MNPRTGQLMSLIMPTETAEVFEADLPDPEQLAQDKLGQLVASFGKYASTKAEPFVSKVEDLNAFASGPETFAQAKIDALQAMVSDYGTSMAAPLLTSIESIQASLPADHKIDNVEQLGALQAIPPLADVADTATEYAKSSEASVTASGVAIALTDELGQPLTGQPFELRLPDGKVAAGITDEMGIAKVAGFAGGTCYLSLPGVDKSIW